MTEGSFAFAVCNASSEAWLASEVARSCPGAAASYRRKGLLTFKLPPGVDPERALDGAVFARVHGRSLGLAADLDALRRTISALAEGPLRLHVYARDEGPEGPAAASTAHAEAIERALREEGRFLEGTLAEEGDRVLDVVVHPGEPSLLGLRTQRGGWRTPGGRVAVDIPSESPSRAYAKLEEALAWSGLVLAQGTRAVELGSAPGGAALALARRGVSVLAVDPAEMDPRVLAFEGPGGARVTALRLKAGALRAEHLPADTALLLADANLAPPIVLRTVASMVSWRRRSVRALILTLKLNDARMVEAIGELLSRVRAMGFRTRATQLPANRKEICVVATLPASPGGGRG